MGCSKFAKEDFKKNKPLVTVVIPVYNSCTTIEQSINSVLSQTYRNIELVIVDDGSTDSSLSVIERYKRLDNRVKIYSRSKKGASAARNYGITKSAGKFVFFLDSDDTIDPEVIDSLVKKVGGGLSSCAMKLVSSHRETIVERDPSYLSGDFIKKVLDNSVQGYACGFLFEKQLCPFFNENVGYCEDMLFLIDYILKNNINKICYLNSDSGCYNYMQNVESVTKVNKNIVGKIGFIALAMEELKRITGTGYVDLIEEKKVQLFEYEMSRAKKKDIEEILRNNKLSKYNGGSLRYKLFSYSFRKKKVWLLLTQFWFENFLRRFA